MLMLQVTNIYLSYFENLRGFESTMLLIYQTS